MTALNFVTFRCCHVVAQIIKTKFVVSSIGDIGGVIGTPLLRLLTMTRHDQSDAETEPAVNVPHPLGVTTCEIIVDRDEVYTVTRKTIEISRQGCDKGLTLTCFHFRDPTEVQSRSTHHLDVVVALANDSICSFADHGEGLRQKIVQRFPTL